MHTPSRTDYADAGNHDLVIRRYEYGDLQAVIDLHNLVLTEAGAHFGDGPWDDDLKNIESAYIDTGGEFLVGECDGRIVAMGGLQKTDPHMAKVRRMRVHPDYQRRGFGKVILDQLESRALALGFRRLFLDTSILLKGALRFYPKYGYHKTHEEDSGEDRLIYFAKELHSPV